MRKLIDDIKNSTPIEKCFAVFAIIVISILFINIPANELARNTRLVRNEMRAMGYYDEADAVVLERTGQARVFRASIPVMGDDGLLIEYWKADIRMSFGFPVGGETRVVPFFD